MVDTQNNILPRTLWLWLPIIALFVQGLIEIFVPLKLYTAMHTENGSHELIQFLILIASIILSATLARRELKNKNMFLTGWYGLFALGCIYIAGEEVSWGQHFFNWATPEEWAQINDQQETNLHNASSWLDQKPRILIEIGVIVGGIILPTLMKLKKEIIRAWLVVITPPKELMLTAILFVFVKIADKIGDATDFIIFKRASEVGEIYIYFFIFLYLLYQFKKEGKSHE